MRNRSYIILMLLFIGFGCSKDNTDPKADTTDPTVDTTDPTVENPELDGLKTINISIELPAGSSFVPDDLYVSSIFTENNKVNNSKGTIKSFDDDSMELSFASNSQGNIVLLSYFNPLESGNIVMNAETTAIALVMLHPWTLDLTSNAKKEAIIYIKSLPEFNNFLISVQSSILSGGVSPLSTQEIVDKVANIQKATVQKISKYIEPLQFSAENSTATVKSGISSASYSVGLYDDKNVLIEHKLVKGLEKSFYLFQEFKNGVSNSTDSDGQILSFNIPRDGKWNLIAKNGLSFDNSPNNKEAAVDNTYTAIVNSIGLISAGLGKLLKNSKCSTTLGLYVFEGATNSVDGGNSFELYSKKNITGYVLTKDILDFFSNKFQSIKDILENCSPESASKLDMLKSKFMGKTLSLINIQDNIENVLNSSALLTDWIQYDKEINYCLLKNGNEISTCLELPVLTTTPLSSITGESALSGGTITNIGGSEIINSGVCWSKSQSPTILLETKTSDGAKPGAFISSIKSLEPNTQYYVRAYATNGDGTAYGNEIIFKTAKTTTIKLTTNSISLIKETSAVSGGNISDDGGSPISVRGICWGTSQNPTISGNKTSDGTGIGDFTSNMAGLEPNTKYFVRAYATNGTSTVYGNEISFNTNNGTIKTTIAKLTTKDASSIKETSAISGGNISDDGGSPISVRGICWGTSQNPTISGNKTSDGTGIGDFTSNMAGLEPNTKYFVRAYATNGAGTAYGNEIIFTTIKNTIAKLTTINASSIKETSAVSGGNISDNGGSPISARGICWGTSQNPTISGNKTTDGTDIGDFTSNLVGLEPNTQYYVRAYATNGSGTAYGNEINFTTIKNTIAKLTTNNVSSIQETSAVSGGNISDNGGSPISARGICWGTSQNPTISGNRTSDGNGIGDFTSIMVGLEPNTKYYVRAYATNGAGTAYGNQVNFSIVKNTVAKLTTTKVSSIQETSAVSGGNISDDGGSSISARGICWGTSQNPTISDNRTSDGNGVGDFTSNMAGLEPNTIYYVRAYAANSTGTAYGNEIVFITSLNTVPTLTTIDISAITETSALSGGSISDDGGSPISIRGICWGTSRNPTVSGSKTSEGNGIGDFNSKMEGLEPGTIYYVRAYAINDKGTAYGDNVMFTTLNPYEGLTGYYAGVGWFTNYKGDGVDAPYALDLNLRVDANGNCTGSMKFDSYTQAMIGKISGSNISFEWISPPAAPFKYTGTFSEDKLTIEGTGGAGDYYAPDNANGPFKIEKRLF